MEREIPIYYKKLICDLSDCKTGDWVYNNDAELCYFEAPEDRNGAPFYSLHYDGIEMGKYFIPRLTTVVQPIDDIARESVTMLMDMLQGGVPKHIAVDAELIIRESVSPAQI